MKHELCKLVDVPLEGAKMIGFFDRQALVYRRGEDFHVTLSVCTHFGGPLELHHDQLICPWHGARFDCVSGNRLEGPAHPNAKAMMLPTRVEDGALYYVWGE